MLYLGIDPGAVSGAFAVIGDQGDYVAADDLPIITSRKLKWVDAPEFLMRLRQIKEEQGSLEMCAMVERQSARPGQGVSSTFVSACAFGSLLATLQVAGIALEFVMPAVWKAANGLLKAEKRASLDRARLLFPAAELERKRDHNRAEALLLARYGWKQRTAPIT
jgi:crossover junction endodeoxyribonuclease RuvC